MKKKDNVKIYVPEKERIRRIQQQIMMMNKTIIAA